jgi:hypothetical protein
MGYLQLVGEAHMQMTHIDNGFYRIAAKDAKALASGKLPRHGYEKLVVMENQHYWLARTWVGERQVWSIRQTNWRLDENGIARLG